MLDELCLQHLLGTLSNPSHLTQRKAEHQAYLDRRRVIPILRRLARASAVALNLEDVAGEAAPYDRAWDQICL
jgi:hypothetical protein